MPLDLYLAFVLACVVLIVIPGPNVALIVANSVAHGARFGLLTVAGTSSAVVVHLTLTVLGASAVLALLAASFDWLRWLGVAYLVWLGIAAWRAPGRRSRAGPPAGALGAAHLRPRLPGRAHQSQDPAVLRCLPAAVHRARPDRIGPAPAARRDLPRDRRRARWRLGAARRPPARAAGGACPAAQPSHRRPAGGRGRRAGPGARP